MKTLSILILILQILTAPQLSYGLTGKYQYDNFHRLTRFERSDGAVIVFAYDLLGNRIAKTATASISGGDINGDSNVDLTDVILSLQVTCGIDSDANLKPAADVNNDGKIGIEEVVYMMQVVSGLRSE